MPMGKNIRMFRKATSASQSLGVNSKGSNIDGPKERPHLSLPLPLNSKKTMNRILQGRPDVVKTHIPASIYEPPKEVLKYSTEECFHSASNISSTRCKSVNRSSTSNNKLSLHNVGTQTTLQVGPDDAFSLKSLFKSFATGHYLRSYRREQWHKRKKWRRKLKNQSHMSSVGIRDGCDSGELTWTRENSTSFIAIPSVDQETESRNAHLSLSDIKTASSDKDKIISVICAPPDVNSKTDKSMMNGKKETLEMSSLSLPVKVERQKWTPLANCQAMGDSKILVNPLTKSRLSVLSSLASSSSDLVVRLSYYSDENICATSYISQHQSPDKDDFDGEDISNVTVPISLSIMIMTTYILIGAIVFCIWEDPNYLKWSYFCFVTLSTIGFGDIVPGRHRQICLI